MAFVLVVAGLRSCCWGGGPSGPWVSGGVLCVSGSVGLGLWFVRAQPPCVLCLLPFFWFFFPGPWVSFRLFPFSCSVVFGFRSSSSLGVPFCGWGSLGLGFGGAGACLCWLGFGLPLACPFPSPYL